MGKRKSSNIFASVLSSIIVFLLVIVFVGFLSAYTDNFSSDLKTFSVRIGNDDIFSDRENYDIVIGKEYSFEIKNLLGVENNLVVSVVPNTDIPESSFAFYLNNTYRQFLYEESLTEGFDIKSQGSSFLFTANKDMSEILESVYPDKIVSGCPTAIDSGVPYFRLTISTADGMQSININFNLKSESSLWWIN